MVSEVIKLADFTISQPQASRAALTFGLRHRWTYFLRTLLDIAELLEPLKRAINEVLIPAVTEHTVTKGWFSLATESESEIVIRSVELIMI